MFSSNTSQVADDKLFVEDCFSCFLYQGNGSTQTITNGIDLAGKGGLVWLKSRSAAYSNALFDTSRGTTKALFSNSDVATQTYANSVTAFNSNGFAMASETLINQNGTTYASWTFREAPKFFDVVTYTGNGTNTQVQSHSLGTTPGMIIVKQTSASGENWVVWHRSLATSNLLYLNTTDAAFVDNGTRIKAADATTFTVGLNGSTGGNGATYVAYLFAHDTTSDGIIQCGSYAGTGAAGNTITLGWEPQWLLIKQSNGADDWHLFDNMRGMPVGSNDNMLYPNLSNAEFTTGDRLSPTATGFTMTGSNLNFSGATYIYIAIRRGPMRTPTSGTSVFSPVANSISPNTPYTTGFPVDWILTRKRASDSTYVGSRLTGGGTYLTTNATTAETAVTSWYFDKDTGTMASNIYTSAQSYIYWNFRRAPSFFDVVCYTGNATNNRAINHNLGAVPELMIIKRRSSSGTGWATYSAPTGVGKVLILNTTDAAQSIPSFYDTAPTATTFTIEANGWTNTSGETYVAYLFASCPGVSKVGSYTGNGSSQTINCGFAAGARFVMIKRTDSAGDWYVWDTARGIVAGNDPRLSLNSTAAEVTTDDSVDTDSSGFVVNQLSATNINVSSATYIYLAVA